MGSFGPAIPDLLVCQQFMHSCFCSFLFTSSVQSDEIHKATTQPTETGHPGVCACTETPVSGCLNHRLRLSVATERWEAQLPLPLSQSEGRSQPGVGSL